LAPFDPLDVAAVRFRTAAPALQRFRPSVPLVLAAVLAMHLALLFPGSPTEPNSSEPLQSTIAVFLLDAEPPPLVAPPAPSLERPLPTARRVPQRRPVAMRDPAPVASPELIAESVRPPRVFAPDGAIVGIEEHVRELDKAVSADAVFDYQIAGIKEAETAFTLPVALEVNGTRFDRYWKPEANLLDDLLERAVKASTIVVSVPVPGMAGYRFGCAVVVIAAAGGCGMSEPALSVYDIDDPTTLSTEEAEACQTLWERITGSRRQDEHRRLRQIYELGCRLPLAGERKAEFR
jgi:hypothetical protein